MVVGEREGAIRAQRAQHGILTARVCAAESAAQQEAYAELLERVLVDFEAASANESLLLERIAAALWRLARVLDFESGAVLERDNAPGDSLTDVLNSVHRTEPADVLELQRGESLSRSLPPEGALGLTMRYESHLTREITRLLTQLEQVRRITAL